MMRLNAGRTPKGVMAGLLFVALLLRIVGINFGPNHPDEHLIINHALAFGTGDLNPHMFYFPTLFLYLLFAVFGGFYALGRMSGHFSGVDQFLQFFLQSSETFYILGRLVSVFFGVATVWVVYHLGREFKNRAVGIWAALLLSVNFLHVRDSHFATMDITLTFFVLLSILFITQCFNGAGQRAYWKAVIAAGVGTAVKYNGFLLLLPIGITYLLVFSTKTWQENPVRSVSQLLRVVLVSAVVFIAAFFCFSPFVILDFGTTREFVSRLYEINRAFHVSWSNHLWLLYDSLGALLFSLAILGFLLQLRRLEAKRIVLVIFAVAYYAMITKAGQPFERYVLALIPVCLVWAADFLEVLIGRFTYPGKGQVRRILLGVLLLAAAIPKTLYQDYLFLQKNTREVAGEWISENIRSGETLVLDDSGECPRLVPAREQVRDQMVYLSAADINSSKKQKRLQAFLDLPAYPEPNYQLYYLTENSKKREFTMLTRTISYSPNELKRVGANYLITSDRSIRANPKFYQTLKPYLELRFLIDPRRDKAKPMSPKGWTYLPIDRYFWNAARPGPLLYVFKLKIS